MPKAPRIGFLATVLGLVLLAGAAQAAGPAEQTLARAQAAFAQRETPEKALLAAELFELALSRQPKSQATALKLSLACYWLGATAKTEKEKEHWHHQEMAAAEKALAINPASLGGNYWLGVNQALWSQTQGVSTKLSTVDPVRMRMKKVIEADPGHDGGGAWRVLGRQYFLLPGLFGGSNRKAAANLRKAISFGPRRWLNHLYLAEVLLDQGEQAEARRLLRAIVAGPALPGFEPDWRLTRRRAKKLLAELEE